jgi:protein involved in polysaccharide export with SLBB domain
MMRGHWRQVAASGAIAALVVSSVIAQEGGAGAPAAAPAQAAPAPLAIPPVQTPTITNQPGTQRAPQDLQRRLQQAQKEGALGAPSAAESAQQNEFQEFIAASTGQRLPLFGYNLFAAAPSTFAPVENIPVTGDYVIGPGDELLIRAWGQIDVDYRAVVDRNGMINIPRVGSIPVAGVQFKDLTAHVRTAVSRNFRNFELLVTMGQLRSIQVFVVGNAQRPGAYTLSSLSTLVNALFAVGGPSGRGSMRAIQLKRGNSIVSEFDVYDLLLSGDKSKDVQLLPGDVIYFPPIGPLAAVSGSVNNAAIFELKGPADVGKLLDLAGGLTTTAQTRRASLERIDERKTRTVDQFALDYDGLKLKIKDGDLVSVFSISPRFENAVSLRGHVALPLRYPWREGLRIHDLIPDKQALITSDYYQRANLAVRVMPSGGQLASDVRKLADEINWDYAVIERLNQTDLSATLIPFNLGKAILEADPANNLALAPGDVVTVFSKNDVGAPAQRRSVVVSLEGEVNFAGVYQATRGETLRQLVTRVGGLTPQAYLFGAEFTRESTRLNQEERLKQAILQFEQDLTRAAATRARNVTNAEEAASLKVEAEAQQATISRLRTLKPTGRIVLELPENPTAADLADITLEDGDRLIVPQRPGMVSVFGTVFNESSFLYRPDKNVSDYLAQAGGPRKEADERSIYVLRADGSVISKRGSGLLVSSLDRMRPMPGDAIVVPEDLTRTTLTKDLKDWTQIFYQFGLGAAALKVIGRP